jgi:hypothetical protein
MDLRRDRSQRPPAAEVLAPRIALLLQWRVFRQPHLRRRNSRRSEQTP